MKQKHKFQNILQNLLVKADFIGNGIKPDPTQDTIEWLWHLWTNDLNKKICHV